MSRHGTQTRRCRCLELPGPSYLPANFLRGGLPEDGTAPALTAKEQQRLAVNGLFFSRGLGYLRQAQTRPQTLGYSLADSPAGLLAWIYEKLAHWSDEYPWSDDEGRHPAPVRARLTADDAFSSSSDLDLDLLVRSRRTYRFTAHLLRRRKPKF